MKGIRFILSHQNPDGGIPAIKPGDVSGCWTTAEALEVFLLSPFFLKEDIPKAKDMVEFLLMTQIPEQGWPLVVGGTTISTMATGHSLSALAYAEKVFSEDTTLVARIQRAIKNAKAWLSTQQNGDGGWGVEPSSPHGKESRMISTCYALHGYFSCGLTVNNSQNVRRGINYIIEIINSDGGWGGKKGNRSDPANTARALTALLRSRKFDINDTMIKKARDFIIGYKHQWRIDIESYVTTGAPGQTVFHSNTPYDVLEALIRCKYFEREVDNLIRWFIDSQEDDGRWYLRDNFQIDKDISVWSTSEAISVLDIAQEHYMKRVFREFDKKLAHRWKYVICLLSAVIVAQFLYLLGFHLRILSWWERLSDSSRQNIIFGIIFALIIGVIANLVSPTIRGFFSQFLYRMKRGIK